MFWYVTLIYNAFIHTTDCRVQTAFVVNYSNGRPRPLGHLTNFYRNVYQFFNFGKFVKIREFFLLR